MAKKTRRKCSNKRSIKNKQKFYGGVPVDTIKMLINDPITADTGDIQFVVKQSDTVSKDASITLLINHTLPFPALDELSTKTFFIQGGMRFGGRVPDIIVDKYDFERATNYLIKNLKLTTINTEEYLTSITAFVRDVFLTSDAVKFVVKNNHPNIDESWTNTIDKSTNCIKSKFRRVSLTNITALPYSFGDCREHALLATFLCNIYKTHICTKYGEDCNNFFRSFYTTSFKVDDVNKTIERIEDHVFCVLFNLIKQKIWIVDPLYSDDTTPTRMTLNNNEAFFVNKKEIEGYDIQDEQFKLAMKLDEVPILWCGNIFINNVKTFRVVNIPKIWNNKMSFIENTDSLVNKCSYDDLLIFNRLIKYDEYNPKWRSFDEWC